MERREKERGQMGDDVMTSLKMKRRRDSIEGL